MEKNTEDYFKDMVEADPFVAHLEEKQDTGSLTPMSDVVDYEELVELTEGMEEEEAGD